MCGDGRVQYNSVTHMDETQYKGASFGGSFSVSRWSLEVLYGEHLRYHNWWTRKNGDFDLAKYLGVRLRFWRHKFIDYLVSYSRESPMVVTQSTFMSCHPMVQLFTKKHIVVPSLETRPRGRPYKSVWIPPPRLMKTQWFFQKDLCKVNLLLLKVATTQLSQGWLRTGTYSPVTQFQVCANTWYKHWSIDPNKENDRLQDANKLWDKPSHFYTYLNQGWYQRNKKDNAGLFNYDNFSDRTKLKQWWPQFVTQELFEHTYKGQVEKDYKNAGYDWDKLRIQVQQTINFWVGNWSAYLLTPQRLDPALPTAYLTIRYNPHRDEGKGNMIWLDPLTKDTAVYSSLQSKCLVQDIPLWLGLYGYADWAQKQSGDPNFWENVRLVIVCGYTSPQLQLKTVPSQGWVPLGDSFARGQLPGGRSDVPPEYQNKWYPTLKNQLEFIEEIVSSGPFVPRDKQNKSWAVTLGYNFKFMLGGNSLPPKQPVSDPCQQSTFPLPGPSGLPVDVQVTDPTTIDEYATFHDWDWRRDLLSRKSLKRMSEYEPPHESFSPGGPKRPRMEVPAAGQQGEDSTLRVLKQLLQESEGPEEPQPPETPKETQEVYHALQRQLQIQQQQQRVLREGLKQVFTDLVLTQRNQYVDPALL